MPSKQPTQLQRAAETFYLDREAEHCTPATLLWYRRYVGALIDWLQAHDVTTAGGITLDLLRAYVVDLQGKGFAPKTVHHHAASAKVFCGFLADEGIIPDNPALRLKRPKINRDVLPALTKEEVATLLEACEHERDTALLLFMLDTGARCAEVVALNIGDVDTKTGAVTITKGKGQKGRIVFLGYQARKSFMRYLLTREDIGNALPLWVSFNTGERLTTWGIVQVFSRLSERSGVHVHPHMLRRTCAIWSLRAGMDIARLALLLGHADLQTVRRYLAIVESDLADTHREHGAVDALLRKK